MSTRVVHHADAISWLRDQPTLAGCSIVTSLPDVSEVGLPLDRWKTWFVDAARLCITKVPDDGVAIFFQTDIKKAGAWVDKGQLVAEAAAREGVRLLWHKIVCRRPPGTVTFGRPAYSHLLCFSRALPLDLSRATADVIADPGTSTWTRGMGHLVCRTVCAFVRDCTPTQTVVDPFCGQGMVLAAANALGLNAVGVELAAKRAQKARNLSVTYELES